MWNKICIVIFLFSHWIHFVKLGILNTDNTVGYDAAINCQYHDKDTHQKLRKCLNIGKEFLNTYISNLKKRRHNFDRCFEFEEFDKCITPLVAKCPDVEHRLRNHWQPFIHLMNCACIGTEEFHVCQHDLQCFEKEYSSVLVKRCDLFYRYNIQQKTRHKCHFLREKINCKEALLSSACSDSVGEISYHVSVLLDSDPIARHKCYVERDPSYEGFQYNEFCPRDFKEDMERCESRNLKDTLLFHGDNDLIADGRPKCVKYACRAYKLYKRCTRDVRNNCPSGVHHVYEYQDDIRKYVLKMDYICLEEKQMYLDRLPCYQQTLENKNLSVCDYLWDKLKPWRQEITAYQFYCQPDNNLTVGMHRTLEGIRLCYETVFTQTCNSASGSVMSELMRRVFQDPGYLRLDYKPECHLHKTTTPRRDAYPPPTDKRIQQTIIAQPDIVTSARHSGYSHSNNCRTQQSNSILVLSFVTLSSLMHLRVKLSYLL